MGRGPKGPLGMIQFAMTRRHPNGDVRGSDTGVRGSERMDTVVFGAVYVSVSLDNLRTF